VAGKKRVPKPATGITALRIFCIKRLILEIIRARLSIAKEGEIFKNSVLSS
jgi:hypothetical protein